MIKVSRFDEVTQIKMGRTLGEEAPWEGAREVLYWTTAYLVDGLLVDTGCRHTAGELADFLEGQYLTLAVNTHHHEDHVGANRILQDRFGIRILASRESLPYMKDRPPVLAYREIVWGYPEPSDVEPIPEVIETQNFRFDVVATPGHCAGHVALVERARGWCFSGDLFITREPKVVGPRDSIDDTVGSMQRLIDLDSDRLVLFTSSGTVEPDGRGALRACVEHLRELAGHAKRLHEQGLSTAEIRDALFGRESVLASITEGEASSENMVRALLQSSL